MTIWQPGMRCVCIKAGPPLAGLDFQPLVVGRVYTVRRVFEAEFWGKAGLCLAELDNSRLIGAAFKMNGKHYQFSGEPGYLADQFRPLSEARLDQFRQHLAPSPRRKAELLP